jgi:hypothetical protein
VPREASAAAAEPPVTGPQPAEEADGEPTGTLMESRAASA